MLPLQSQMAMTGNISATNVASVADKSVKGKCVIKQIAYDEDEKFYKANHGAGNGIAGFCAGLSL